MTGSIPVHTYPCNNLMYHGKRYTIALVNRNNSKDLFYGPVYGKLMLEILEDLILYFTRKWSTVI